MRKQAAKWFLLALLNVAALSGFWWTQASTAAPKVKQQPFGNPLAQRNEMIRELKEIKKLLETQNELLRKQAEAKD